MRKTLSALVLSTALATGFGLAAPVLFTPAIPAAQAQATQPGEVDVDALLKLIPADKAKATYESKSYDAISGVTTVVNLKIADPANEATNFVQLGEVSLKGLDLSAFDYVFNFAAYGATAQDTFKPLFGEVSVKNVTITMNGAPAGSIEGFSFGGVQMKQLQVKPPGTNGAMASDADEVKFVGALLDSIITGPLEVTNVAIDSAGNKFTLKHVALSGYTRGQFGPSSIEGMDTSSTMGMSSSLASASAEGGDISKVLPWMVKGEMPPVTAEPLLSFGAGSLSGLAYDVMGTKVAIGSYAIDPISFYWLVPSSLKIAISDVMVTPSGENGFNPLAEIGLDHLDLDFGLDWSFDGAAGTASLKELKIAESQLADTTLQVNLTGINLADLVDPNKMQMAAMGVGLSYAQLYLKNNGGFQKLLEVSAKEQGSTPEAIKQQALDQLTALEGGMPGPDGQAKPLSERMKSIVAAAKAFINSPGTLTVKVQPASPVTAMTGMGAVMDPMGAADALGVTVESTPQ